MIKVGVIGSTGYSGQELVDVLLRHPGINLACLTARFDAPLSYGDVYPRFKERTDLVCRTLDIEEVSQDTAVVFLALPHTVSMDIAAAFIENGKKVIDLSADYRLPAGTYSEFYGKEHADADGLEKAVYGLPELNREKIREASLIANPGCYPTGVILGLLPVIEAVKKAGLNIVVDSKSGTTGAGRKAALELSFSEVDGNFKSYKANVHQHIPEMEHVLSGAAGDDVKINFVPHLLPIKRGILSTIYIEHKDLPGAEELHKMYSSFFEDEPFVRVKKLGEMPEIQDVVGTNFCDIGVTVARGMVIIVSVIDNLLKGASGQAVQNMNIMYGLDEKAGLV